MTDRPHEFPSAPARIVKCSSCGADIVFFRTAKNNLIPVNAETVLALDDRFDHKRHISHFATCEFAAQHRKPR